MVFAQIWYIDHMGNFVPRSDFANYPFLIELCPFFIQNGSYFCPAMYTLSFQWIFLKLLTELRNHMELCIKLPNQLQRLPQEKGKTSINRGAGSH